MPKPTKRDHLGGGNERATLGSGVCTENSILVAYMTNRLTSAAMIALLCFFLTLFASVQRPKLANKLPPKAN